MQKISAKNLYDKLQAEELRLIDVREVDELLLDISLGLRICLQHLA